MPRSHPAVEKRKEKKKKDFPCLYISSFTLTYVQKLFTTLVLLPVRLYVGNSFALPPTDNNDNDYDCDEGAKALRLRCKM
jgi:hypothetical protein